MPFQAMGRNTIFIIKHYTSLFLQGEEELFKGLLSKHLFTQLKALCTTIASGEVIIPVLDTYEATAQFLCPVLGPLLQERH